jgi:hypothetical protein
MLSEKKQGKQNHEKDMLGDVTQQSYRRREGLYMK